MPVILFVPTPLILAYYNGYAICGLADDQTRMWTVALIEYISMDNAMLVIHARNGARPSYYKYNYRFNTLSGSPLLRLFNKILDVLKYFGLYKFALRMGTGPVLTAVAFHSCREVG